MPTVTRALFALLGLTLAAERAGAASIAVSFSEAIDQVVGDDLPALLEAPPAGDDLALASDYSILLAANAADELEGQDAFQIGVIDELAILGDTGSAPGWPVP
jgi:hypothetical protein